MAMVFRAETPVQDLEADANFAEAVGASDYNIYAQGVAANSYLDLQSKSLNNLTANGTITRAEAIYLLVSRYFADDLANVDIKGVTFSDAKDGGDIAEQQKFIEDAKAKDYWKSYELTYAIQNPDNGLPTDLFKALVVAKNKGLISNNTRWDEGITRAEAIEILVEVLKRETGISSFNAKQGIIEGYEVTIEDESIKTVDDLESENGIVANSTHDDVILGDDEYKGGDEITGDDRELFDSIWADLEKQHPEWFANPSPAATQQQGSGATNKSPDYISVDGPVDNGVLPTYNFGESGQDGIDKNVTVY